MEACNWESAIDKIKDVRLRKNSNESNQAKHARWEKQFCAKGKSYMKGQKCHTTNTARQEHGVWSQREFGGNS